MDDIAAKLAELLDSPDGMDSIKSLAGMLLNNTGDQKADDDSPGGLGFNPDEIQNIMRITNALKSTKQDDERSRLLMALKPHLGDERRDKVDKAVKILKLVNLMPLIQESGLF
ncbi:MAG: hypothetical protein BGN88_02435 [Clostridiales bacterium 43-6]|nr:MAG: hypothetical protein BGN88_02435 [Clostridiales bacterium 43-6]